MASQPEPRRNTPAANADILGDDASFDGSVAPAPDASRPRGTETSADGTAARGAGLRGDSASPREPGEARAGKDINQPGFVKDPEAGKP